MFFIFAVLFAIYYNMKNQILNYYLTDHFMLRGWDRSIDKQLLYKVLPFVKCTECDKDVIELFLERHVKDLATMLSTMGYPLDKMEFTLKLKDE